MKSLFDLSKYIEDIELNGLKGRMICVPARVEKARTVNILFFHGHHSSIERMAGVAEMLSDYGNFCLPDLPGFGGMDPLYNIGLKPSIDNLADYMAAFIKLHYGKQKKFVAVGYSFGFLVLTRMLQRYPELQNQIIDVVGIATFVHHDAFLFSKTRILFYQFLAGMHQYRFTSFFAREIFMRKWFIGAIHSRTRNAKGKYEGLDKHDYRKVVNFEVKLWRCNDVRTRSYTTLEMLRINLIKSQLPIHKNLISIIVDADHYFNNHTSEQQLRMIYDDVRVFTANVDAHGMSIVASAKDVLPYFPVALRRHLKSLR